MSNQSWSLMEQTLFKFHREIGFWFLNSPTYSVECDIIYDGHISDTGNNHNYNQYYYQYHFKRLQSLFSSYDKKRNFLNSEIPWQYRKIFKHFELSFPHIYFKTIKHYRITESTHDDHIPIDVFFINLSFKIKFNLNIN